jgi:hypothetical protein
MVEAGFKRQKIPMHSQKNQKNREQKRIGRKKR